MGVSYSSDGPAEARCALLTRRQMLKLLGLGAGAVGLSALGVGALLRAPGARSLGDDETMVRNPAFQEVAGHRSGCTILYCQRSEQEYLAYELNDPGAGIYASCTQHYAHLAGERCSVRAILNEHKARLDEDQVREFLARLVASGLVYCATPASKAYFVRQGDA